MNFYSEFIEKNRNIRIPNLQRDYVQGAAENLKKGIAQNFIGSLIEALSGGEPVDLTYIYGYDAGSSFVPVDGQQRLTTIWLLYAYIYARNGESIPVELLYDARDFAQDFTSEIRFNLHNSIPSNDFSLKEYIIRKTPWFVNSWLNNVSVESSLNVLNIIHKYLHASDCSVLLQRMKEDNISFAFHVLKDASPDIYIKMNGRGKLLSEFENLKSWLDDKVEHGDFENCFQSQWKDKMDNEWANLFWRNRNKAQDNPEETDDEQLRFFYNLLYIYWAKRLVKKEQVRLIGNLDEREQICELLDCKVDDLESQVLEHLKRNRNFTYSLYLIDKLNLVTKEFIEFFCRCSNCLPKIETILPESKFFGHYVADDKHTLLYSIFFCSEPKENNEEPTYQTLALCNALLAYISRDGGHNFFSDWVRVIRNLIFNTTIDSKNIGAILLETDRLAAQSEQILDYLRQDNCYINNFSGAQIQEEIEKAKQMQDVDWYTKIVNVENDPFFCGTIRYLFTNEESVYDWTHFEKKLATIHEIECSDKDNQWRMFSDFVHYADRDEILKSLHEFGLSKRKDYFLKSELARVTHHFLLQDGMWCTNKITTDITSIISALKKDVWILRDWQKCRYVLSNYSRRMDVFNNGYVYVVDTARNRFITDLLYGNTRISYILIPNCWGNNIVTYSETFYKGLYTDFTYNGHRFRLRDWEVGLVSNDNNSYSYGFDMSIDETIESFNDKLEKLLNKNTGV